MCIFATHSAKNATSYLLNFSLELRPRNNQPKHPLLVLWSGISLVKQRNL